MISSKHLSRLKDGFVSKIVFIFNSLLNFGNIDFRHPGVSVNDCEENIINIDSMFLEFLFFKVLGTPRNIRGFSFLLKLSNFMMAVAHQFEVLAIFSN